MSQRQIKWIHKDEIKLKNELKVCEERIEQYRKDIETLNHELEHHKSHSFCSVCSKVSHLQRLLEGTETESSIYYETLDFFGLHPRDVKGSFIKVMINKYFEMTQLKYKDKCNSNSTRCNKKLNHLLKTYNQINRLGGGKITPNKISWNEDRIKQIIMSVGRLNLYGKTT